MGLRLVNAYTSSLAAAIMFRSPDVCAGEGQNFEVRGWWNLAPGGSALVHNEDLTDVNRYWFFHAHAADGALWQGDWHYPCPPQAFSRCWGIGVSDGIDRGFALLDIGDSDDHVLRFIP